MRKHILIFGHGYGPQFVDINNQYTHVFPKDQYEVTVMYLTGAPDETIRQKHTAEQVIFLNSPKAAVRGLKISVIKTLWQLCRKKRFDIVICHRYKPTYIMLWVNLVYKSRALFSIMHEIGTVASLPRRLTIALLARQNVLFAGVSNAVRDDIRHDIWSIPPERVLTLYNMIDVADTEAKLLDRATARQQLNINSDVFLFGNVGRLVKNKDQKTLIIAFAAIKPQCPQAKLLIAGAGPLEAELKQQASELNVAQDVIFTGFLADGFRYMKAFDVYISSSTQEAFGRVLLEAMIAQIPIIATRVNGVPEVIGDTGPLIPAADPEEMAKTMLQIYQASAAERQQHGMRGYHRAVQDFSFQKFDTLFWQLPIFSTETP